MNVASGLVGAIARMRPDILVIVMGIFGYGNRGRRHGYRSRHVRMLDTRRIFRLAENPKFCVVG
jgi:hypothetical protein